MAANQVTPEARKAPGVVHMFFLGIYGNTCAIYKDGSVKCAGNNNFGQLGLGDKLSRGTASEISALKASKKIAIGADTICALSNQNTIKCSGRNNLGQAGGDKDTSSFINVASLKNATDVVAALRTFCAVADGNVYCWGSNKSEAGAILSGKGPTGGDDKPHPIPQKLDFSKLTKEPIVKLNSGVGHMIAVDKKGNGFIWGTAVSLGKDENCLSKIPAAKALCGNKNSATEIVPIKGISGAIIGFPNGLQEQGACVISNDLSLFCIGMNPKTGFYPTSVVDKKNTPSYHTTWTKVSTLANTRVSLAGFNFCENTGGNVKCTGLYSGVVDNPVSEKFNQDSGVSLFGKTAKQLTPDPVLIDSFSGAIQVYLSRSISCFVSRPGNIWCMGYNGSGALADGTNVSSGTPVLTTY